jgi:hypothetical protein
MDAIFPGPGGEAPTAYAWQGLFPRGGTADPLQCLAAPPLSLTLGAAVCSFSTGGNAAVRVSG